MMPADCASIRQRCKGTTCCKGMKMMTHESERRRFKAYQRGNGYVSRDPDRVFQVVEDIWLPPQLCAACFMNQMPSWS